ncbi:protein of unknown function [Rhodovastum atsumiense]|nr:protein of unknown function [Rhodovastum atsumiense]
MIGGRDSGRYPRWWARSGCLLAPFLNVLGRKTRRIWAPLCLRGLLGPGERNTNARG